MIRCKTSRTRVFAAIAVLGLTSLSASADSDWLTRQLSLSDGGYSEPAFNSEPRSFVGMSKNIGGSDWLVSQLQISDGYSDFNNRSENFVAAIKTDGATDWLASQLQISDGYSGPVTNDVAFVFAGASRTEYADAHENARKLLSRPLESTPSAEIIQHAGSEQPDAFRQAMILLGH